MNRRPPWLSAALLIIGMSAAPGIALSQVQKRAFEEGVLPERWQTGGPKCMEMPEWQVHEYNPGLFILRQSGCTNYEKPFLYLLFGKERALLLDTGAVNGNLASSLQRTVHRWLIRNSRRSIPLFVVHTHGHGDHSR